MFFYSQTAAGRDLNKKFIEFHLSTSFARTAHIVSVVGLGWMVMYFWKFLIVSLAPH
jgi:hypothetical protein